MLCMLARLARHIQARTVRVRTNLDASTQLARASSEPCTKLQHCLRGYRAASLVSGIGIPVTLTTVPIEPRIAVTQRMIQDGDGLGRGFHSK